jgi:putative transposase
MFCLGTDDQSFHILLRTGYVPISTVMRRLLTGYAQQFNRRHKRHGQLFQNRFKSILLFVFWPLTT